MSTYNYTYSLNCADLHFTYIHTYASIHSYTHQHLHLNKISSDANIYLHTYSHLFFPHTQIHLHTHIVEINPTRFAWSLFRDYVPIFIVSGNCCALNGRLDTRTSHLAGHCGNSSGRLHLKIIPNVPCKPDMKIYFWNKTRVRLRIAWAIFPLYFIQVSLYIYESTLIVRWHISCIL